VTCSGASKGIMAPFRPPLKQTGEKAPQLHDEEGDAAAYGPRTIQMLAGAALAAKTVRASHTAADLAAACRYGRSSQLGCCSDALPCVRTACHPGHAAVALNPLLPFGERRSAAAVWNEQCQVSRIS